jgi:hypothetical protein
LFLWGSNDGKTLPSRLETQNSLKCSATVSLGFKGYRVPDVSHVTNLSLGSEESMGCAIGFVIEGLINEETVCIVSPDTKKKIEK